MWKCAGDSLVAVRNLRVLRRRRIELAHLVGKLLHLLFQRLQVGEDGHALVKDGATGELQAILRQVAERRVLGGDDAAVVERLDAAQNLQQRGFAGAIGAHQPTRSLRREQPVKIFEKKFGAEAFAGRGKLDHERSRSVAFLLAPR